MQRLYLQGDWRKDLDKLIEKEISIDLKRILEQIIDQQQEIMSTLGLDAKPTVENRLCGLETKIKEHDLSIIDMADSGMLKTMLLKERYSIVNLEIKE